jgi:signal transduction histidine kinase
MEPGAPLGRLSGLRARASPRWRSAWLALPVGMRVPWVFVGVTALMGMVLLGGGLLDGTAGGVFALGESVVVPFGVGLLLLLVAQRLEGQDRQAWLTIGIGVALRGVGEVVWQIYFVAGNGVPYPSVADGFCLASYPVIFLGVLLLPHLRPRKWERVRLTLDATAGSVALLAIGWSWYLKDMLSHDPAVGLLGNLVNLAYPLVDLILLIAILVLATRRSAHQFDGRLLALGVGLLVLTGADVSYILQLQAGTINQAGSMVGLFYGAACGPLVVCALLVARPAKARDLADRPSRMWPLVVPYTPVLALFALTIGQIGNQRTVLVVASAVVATLVMARQTVAIRETRDVVEKQRNDLVASVSHELRTPLTGVMGFVEILHESPDLDREERIEMLGLVASQTEYLDHIVGDLLRVAHGATSEVQLIPEDVAVGPLVTSAIETLIGGGAAAAITTHIEPDLIVRADRGRIRQVLLNYLINAVRYGQGNVEIYATGTPDDVHIEVHDDGPGVPKKYELRIWDRFERGAHTNLSRIQGSGLGLPIARDLIAAHHGHTGYRRSEHLGGACFWLTLPGRPRQAPTQSATVTGYTGQSRVSRPAAKPPVVTTGARAG